MDLSLDDDEKIVMNRNVNVSWDTNLDVRCSTWT